MSEIATEKPIPDPAPPADTPEPEKGQLWCCYDETLLRYVGGVGSKAEATKVAKGLPKGHRHSIRKV